MPSDAADHSPRREEEDAEDGDPRLEPALAAAPRVLRRLRGQREEMTELLRELAELESPTRSPETHGPLLARLDGELREAGLRTRRLAGGVTGGHLFARGGSGGCPAQLLLGHLDTVWPVGTLDDMPVTVEGGRMRGPGVFDMKGGLVQMRFALSALDHLGLEPSVEPAVLVTSDEEIGSPDSSRWIRALARRSCRALVLEPALGPVGALKTARKSTGQFEIRITGRGSHAGLAPDEGASAIQELSHVVQALHALSDAAEGVSVNVGEIQGGVRPNVVAPSARATVDVRVPTRQAALRLEEEIGSLEPVTPGTRIAVDGGMSRPPMEPTPGSRRLWACARRLGRGLGLELEEGRAGGASDGNTTSQFVPTLDGLGPVGDGAHASHEHVQLDRMPERAALLALLLLLPPDVTDPAGRSGARGDRVG